TTGLAPTQAPAWQVSLCVQALPSLQVVALALAGFAEIAVAGLQVPGVWPWSEAAATPGLLPTLAPAWAGPLCVQALPSLQGAVLLVCTHPVAGLHESSVQGLPSSQLGAAPPTHTPPLQVSLVVHALPSSHGPVLFTCLQPVAGSQESVVQGLLSLQLSGGSAAQGPRVDVWLGGHALPSSHAPGTFACWHPVAGLHESAVQTLPSSQLSAGPPTQTPPAHVSCVVHALPSSHVAVLLVCVQPVAGLQASFVQGLLSLQFGAGPP